MVAVAVRSAVLFGWCKSLLKNNYHYLAILRCFFVIVVAIFCVGMVLDWLKHVL